MQQYLPLAVLKPRNHCWFAFSDLLLQQYLPLAVLKLNTVQQVLSRLSSVATVLTACGIETAAKKASVKVDAEVATVLTACGIETAQDLLETYAKYLGCNSTYRLRY